MKILYRSRHKPTNQERTKRKPTYDRRRAGKKDNLMQREREPPIGNKKSVHPVTAGHTQAAMISIHSKHPKIRVGFL